MKSRFRPNLNRSISHQTLSASVFFANSKVFSKQRLIGWSSEFLPKKGTGSSICPKLSSHKIMQKWQFHSVILAAQMVSSHPMFVWWASETIPDVIKYSMVWSKLSKFLGENGPFIFHHFVRVDKITRFTSKTSGCPHPKSPRMASPSQIRLVHWPQCRHPHHPRSPARDEARVPVMHAASDRNRHKPGAIQIQEMKSVVNEGILSLLLDLNSFSLGFQPPLKQWVLI